MLALPPTDGPVEWPEAASAGALDRNSYDYRLVVSRKLYDRAVGTAMSPSLAGLAPPSAAHVNPFDLAGLGVADGTEVQVIGARGSVVLPLAADLARAPRLAAGAVQRAGGVDRRHRRRPRAGQRRQSGADVISAVLALDPLLIGDLLWTPLIIVLLKVVVIFVVGLVSTLFMVWFERKIIAGMQNRVGPNKAGPFGTLQTLADGVKLFFKEDLLPDKADRFVFKLAPYLAFVPAFLVWAVIPLGGDFTDGDDGIVTWFGEQTRVQLADPPIGILLVLAVSSIAVYGHMLAGWASGSKYPLLGSVRSTAQMISYEAALGLSLAAVILTAGTLSTAGIVTEQDTLSNWNIVATAVVPFVIFMISVTAELNRPPFDLVEAEQELVGGFNTEYSSIRFGLFFLAEFMGTITMSAVIVTLFLGGPQPIAFGDTTLDIPGIPGGLEGTIWFLLKVLLFLYVYVWLRATLPRLRYDQLMDLGWKVLIPIALGWFLLLAAIRVGRDNDWDTWAVIAVTLVVLATSYALMVWALRVSQRNREREGAFF